MVQDTAWRVNKVEAVAEQGMVAAMHPLAAAAGLEMLQGGGNAVDAAVAAAFASAVVEPFKSGVGGVALLVFFNSRDGTTTVVDGGACAPAAAREDMFELLDPASRAGMYGWRATRDDAQNTGYRSACVPGMPAALLLALERFGTLPRQRVLQPAIRLAEDGFELDWYVASTIAFYAGRLRRFPATARAYLKPDGSPMGPGSRREQAERLAQPDLARTLRCLAEGGAEAFYQGEIADVIARDMAEHGGLITRADLAGYRANASGPGLRGSYRGVQFVGASEMSGNGTVFEALNLLERFDLAGQEAGSAAAYHLIAEVCRQAFLDRFAHVADPAFTPVPWDGLLSKAYAGSLASRIDPCRANPEARAGDPWAFQSGERPTLRLNPARAGEGGTTHITAVDRDRNMVALTSTIAGQFGSRVVIPGTGVLLNNGMTWFDPESGSINSIAPGKRVVSAMAPTLAFRDGRPLLALGAPGGRRVISAVLQALVNVIDFGMGVQDAVTRPRVHSEGRETLADGCIDPSVLARLEEMGHVLDVREDSFVATHFGRPNGILIDPRTGLLHGGVHQFQMAWALGM